MKLILNFLNFMGANSQSQEFNPKRGLDFRILTQTITTKTAGESPATTEKPEAIDWKKDNYSTRSHRYI